MATVGIGVAGFDHWYAGIGACDEAAQDPRCRLLAVGGTQSQLRDFARERGVAFAGVDPLEVVAHPGVDVVVAAASSDQNPALVAEAAARGKAVISVKPMAVTVRAGETLAATVRRTGVPFFPLECQGRLQAASQRIRAWWGQGERLGAPLSALIVMRGTVPWSDWPGHRVEATWWLDPLRVPGGGWVDHAIYDVDFLRWALGAEVRWVYGQVSARKHPQLRVEDFGVGTLTFDNGVIASLEVTWHGTPGVSAGTRQFVGAAGQLIASWPTGDGWLVATEGSGREQGAAGWQREAAPTGRVSVIAHMLDHLLDGTPLAAGVECGLANLRACVAFYRSAAEGRAVSPADV
jgi:predicted dehydrogenase